MAENTKIEWTDHTINLWWGCSKVHTGCKNCYAESLAKRYGDDVWGENKKRKIIKSAFDKLDKIQKRAKSTGKKETVFIGSMMDIFESNIRMTNSGLNELDFLRNKLFTAIENGLYNDIVFLLLTKRPNNIKKQILINWFENPPKNVWIGVSISDEDTHWKMRKDILNSGWIGKVFYSIEPQTKRISSLDLRHVDWVINGCESGRFRRQYSNDWAKEIINICKEQEVPCFIKQIRDEKGKVVKDLTGKYERFNVREFPVW